MKKCPSNIQCKDSNPRPLDHQSIPTITTWPGLPLNSEKVYFSVSSSRKDESIFFALSRSKKGKNVPD